MSGKYFKKINGQDVDLTTLFEPDGTNNNTYYPDLDISNTAKHVETAYARPSEFGYKIKDGTGTTRDLSEYCDMTPIIIIDSSNVEVTNFNSMSGYIVGGSGGGGGGSGGVYDTTWLSTNDYDGRIGGAGGAGQVKWFSDITLNGVNNVNISVGNKGGGGGGGDRYRGSGGWSKDGINGGDGNETVLYSGNDGTIANGTELVKSLGGGGGNKGTRVSTGGNRGNAGSAGKCGGHGSTSHQTHDDNNFTTDDSWSSTYNYVTPLPKNGTAGGNYGNGGIPTSNNANGGNTGGNGAQGFAVLYLKR